MAKIIIKFPLHNFFHEVFEAAKKRQDDIKRRKTIILYQEAYRFFLDEYLAKVAARGIVDLPPFMYETGRVICEVAKQNAEYAMLQVIKNDRIDYCYKKYLKQFKEKKVF